MEAHKVIKDQQQPFFAIIQTAGNHRPYTIPTEDADFIQRKVSDDTLRKYGFDSPEEYHAFAYTDYCYQKFIEAAKKERYFENTIFVFVGDHGVEGNAGEMYPRSWTSQRLSDEHVPLLYYAPKLLTPQWRNEVVSQIDVLPTLAGMVAQPYSNTTLGRDLLSPKKKTNAAFIIHHDEGNIGVVTDDYYYVKNIRINREELVSVKQDQLTLSPAQADSVKKSLSKLTSALSETAKWMLVNNKPKKSGITKR
jgi:phosphoglycerol transferase MdoB-like AlkP superfamily enzyme